MIRMLLTGLVALCLAAAPVPAPSADAGTIDALLAAMNSGDENRRLDAIEALGERGDARALQPLLDRLTDSRSPGLDRMAAASALGGLGDARAVEPLIAALRTDMRRRTGVMMAIIPALGALADKRAVSILLEALNKREDHWLARESAATALGRIGDPGAVPALINAAWMADTRTAAIGALASITDRRAIEVLVSALQSDEEPEARQSAAVGLIFLGVAAVPPLAEIVARRGGEFHDPGRRLLAIEILGAIGGTTALMVLEAVAKDPDVTVQLAARAALRRFLDD